MGFQVGFVGVFVCLETRCLDEVLQDSLHANVELGFCQRTALHLLHQVLDLGFVAGFHEVVARLDLSSRVAKTCPVGHDDSVKTPFVSQDGGEQFAVLLGERSVKAVVRRHHGPRLCLSHGNLESLQIDFSEHSLGHHLIDSHSVGLLGIGGEMLQ